MKSLKTLDLYQNDLFVIPQDILKIKKNIQIFLKDSCIKQPNKKAILNLIKTSYALDCVTFTNTPQTLKELCCRSLYIKLNEENTLENVFTTTILSQNAYDTGGYPLTLLYLISCPSGYCHCCGQPIFCSAFYILLMNYHNINDADDIPESTNRLLLYCSAKCYCYD